MILRLLFAVIVAGGLIACGSPTPSVNPAVSLDKIAGDWQLDHGTVDGTAIAIVGGSDITLSIHAPSITGTSGCNSWGGRLALVDGEIRVTEVASTAMLCADDVMASEVRFIRGLDLVRSGARDGDQLVLAGPGVELVFGSLAPPPAAELIGTTWRLEALGQGDVHGGPIGDPATLAFDAGGSFSGSTGCRAFTGSWIEETGAIAVTSMSMAGECPADRADQDGFVVTVLGDGFRAQLDGDQLTLTARGSTLLYVAEPDAGG